MQYIIGSWYRQDELAKRSCIFHTSSAIATMFSGYLMAAVYHLGGRGGFAGWQWCVPTLTRTTSSLRLIGLPRLFIVDGIISLPIAIAGYFVLPDVPEISRAFYLKKEVT
jgi:MFS transporter, ACS family, pantothenate transporter